MNLRMQRGFSIFLVLVFGLGPLTPALGASQDVELPACCRRHGAHHCAMAMQMARRMEQARSGSAPIFTTPLTCPYYPGPGALLVGPTPALASAAAPLPEPVARTFAQTVRRSSVFSRPATTHAGRGPPTAI